ncbi:hypothetical protein EGR_08374 [Echinococcus granulosus]|uniref:Uncharacterized protein n=1 Tax=Echinococcus granulosus TaxID=6210 RepID=W6U8P4_ECHGR|nr:hypothetical protein EGR_08374 [Echinococcus granulosus]EUB56796.1 hypothetical protein EGR_08374 [Echinococcus granulosus]
MHEVRKRRRELKRVSGVHGERRDICEMGPSVVVCAVGDMVDETSLEAVAVGVAGVGFALPGVALDTCFLLVTTGAAGVGFALPGVTLGLLGAVFTFPDGASLPVGRFAFGDDLPSANIRAISSNTRPTLKNFMTRLISACSYLIYLCLYSNSRYVGAASTTQPTAAPLSHLLHTCINCMQCLIFTYVFALRADTKLFSLNYRVTANTDSIVISEDVKFPQQI